MSKASSVPFKKTYYFTIPEKGRRNGAIGENVSLWKKPNSKEVSAFEGNSVGGTGWIGFISDELLTHHIGNDGKYDAVLTYKDNEHAYIEVTLYDVDQTKIKQINNANDMFNIGCVIAVAVLIILIVGYCS